MVTDSPDPLRRLAERLDVPRERLAFLGRLDPADLAALDVVVGDAQHAEDAAMEKGLRDAVRAVPGPLRSRVKGLLFPEASDPEPTPAPGTPLPPPAPPQHPSATHPPAPPHPPAPGSSDERGRA